MFYSEMIDDRIEDGIPEEEAVLMAGPIDDIVEQTVAEVPLTRIAKERIRPKRDLMTWEIALLVIGSPLWLSLGIAALALVLSVYLVLWVAVIALWAVFATLVLTAIACVGAGVVSISSGDPLAGVAIFGGGLICAGAAILMLYGSKRATVGVWALSKRILLRIKRCFIRKEVA